MSTLIYGFLWVLFNGISRICFSFRTIGTEHVPKRGGLLIAANHSSYLDIPLLGSGIRRRVAFLGRQDLFPLPGLRPILQWLGWIPIRMDRLDRTGFGLATSLINKGQAVVIFPEGKRSEDGQLKAGKQGLGVLVAETGCPVVPVYLEGIHNVLPVGARWPRLQPVRVIVGKPIDFTSVQGRLSGKQFYRYVSQTVMEHIAELGQVSAPKMSWKSHDLNEETESVSTTNKYKAE